MSSRDGLVSLGLKIQLQAQVMAEFVKAHSIPSILLLDGMWTLFNDPVGTLIGTNGKWAKTVKDTVVFPNSQFPNCTSPFLKQNTSAYRVLCLLNDTHIAWDAVHANALDHRITSSHLPIQHLPLQLSYDTKKTLMKAFSQFLRNLLPVVKDGPLAHVNSTNKKCQKVAKKPDFYMPFCDLAPTRITAQNIIYSDVDWLRTDVGFWNIASKEPDTYFINSNAYGTANKNRNLEAIETLWKQRRLWAPFIQTNPDPVEVYEFLVYPNRFRNVGPLTAMLLTGDLCKAGVIRQPTIEELGALVWKVKKGAVSGIKLGLVAKCPTEAEVINAVRDLWEFLDEELTVAEKAAMSFDFWCQEHGLCKYHCV
ncbi:hypothetical protein Hypma_005589 [Hypsizygus marmoreus]|uniref:Uncharacterized protein n=1 Tax=Hypsizygus marmoreus TaxID=39966 RepID=A0A369JZ30_HYPMA|nr:hypothetical protein Hypma_005589 [Hypsizygus marmoreus]